jgi:hypothetical protein
MNVAVRVTGLEELRAALVQLPDKIEQQANDEVKRTMNEAAAALIQAYPVGTAGRYYKGQAIDPGGLRRGVKKRFRINRRGFATGTVRSESPHAHLWEFGTVNRETKKGWKRGQIDKEKNYNHGLVGIAQKERREMEAALVALVRNHGFKVQSLGG